MAPLPALLALALAASAQGDDDWAKFKPGEAPASRTGAPVETESGGGPSLKLYGKVNCKNGFPNSTAKVAPNAFLIGINEDSVPKDKYGFVHEDLPVVVEKVNQLLRAYGFDALKAQPFDSKLYYGLPLESFDHAFNYRRNSFVLTFFMGSLSAPIGQTEPCTICPVGSTTRAKEVYGKLCPEEFEVFGHWYSGCAEGMGLSVMKTGDDSKSRERRAAYLAYLAVHELIHAVHMRILADAVSGRSDEQGRCAGSIPLAAAQKRTRELRAELGIPGSGMHQTSGILTAGGGLTGSKNADVAVVVADSKVIDRCLYDPKLPEAALKDLSGILGSSARCQGDVPVSAFFKLPEANRKAIGAFLARRASQDCWEACYYGMPDRPAR